MLFDSEIRRSLMQGSFKTALIRAGLSEKEASKLVDNSRKASKLLGMSQEELLGAILKDKKRLVECYKCGAKAELIGLNDGSYICIEDLRKR